MDIARFDSGGGMGEGSPQWKLRYNIIVSRNCGEAILLRLHMFVCCLDFLSSLLQYILGQCALYHVSLY